MSTSGLLSVERLEAGNAVVFSRVAAAWVPIPLPAAMREEDWDDESESESEEEVEILDEKKRFPRVPEK